MHTCYWREAVATRNRKISPSTVNTSPVNCSHWIYEVALKIWSDFSNQSEMLSRTAGVERSEENHDARWNSDVEEIFWWTGHQGWDMFDVKEVVLTTCMCAYSLTFFYCDVTLMLEIHVLHVYMYKLIVYLSWDDMLSLTTNSDPFSLLSSVAVV